MSYLFSFKHHQMTLQGFHCSISFSLVELVSGLCSRERDKNWAFLCAACDIHTLPGRCESNHLTNVLSQKCFTHLISYVLQLVVRARHTHTHTHTCSYSQVKMSTTLSKHGTTPKIECSLISFYLRRYAASTHTHCVHTKSNVNQPWW